MAASFHYNMMYWDSENLGPSLELLDVVLQNPDLQADFFSINRDVVIKTGIISRPPALKKYPICSFHTHLEGEECWASRHTFASHPSRK
jgi:hypothetical protein